MQELEKTPWESYPNYRNVNDLAQTNARKMVWDIQYRRVLSVWPWMIVSAFLFLLGAWGYLRYQNDVYEVNAGIVVEDNQEITLGQALFSTRDPLNNQIAVLQSPTLMKRVVDSMGLNYRAIIKGRFKDKDLYGAIEWKVLDRPSDDKSPVRFEIKSDSSGFEWVSGNLKGKGKWGEAFTIGQILVLLKKNVSSIESEFLCYETDAWSEAFNLSAALRAGSGKESNVVEMRFTDYVKERGVHILNYIIKSYNNQVLEEKSKSLEQSISFIQNRIIPLSDELDSIETGLARYKAQKGFVGTTANGEMYLQKTQEYNDQLNQAELQKSILAAIENFLRNPSTKDEQLSLIGINDAYLQGLVMQFQSLRNDRDKLAVTAAETNPQLQIIDKRLSEIKNNIEVQLSNYKRNIQLAEQNYRRNMASAQSLLTSTPKEEKNLLEKMRQQSIKQSLFLLLLQKREEASIALSAVSVKTNVLKPARMPSKPISPNRRQIMLIAFSIGIWVPLLITILREFLNNKIISRNQLQQMLSAPVIAELDLVEKSTDIIELKRKDRSIFGEQIRALRTNLRYYAKEGKPFFVMVTSSMSGEGKSFISANLAASFSLQGKRVALVEFDLRRPKLSKRFDQKSKQGISTVLIGKDDPKDIPVRVFEEGHVDLFPAGPIPPNPSELMSNDKMNGLKAYLESNYDVVIVDTPPNGIVADAQLINSWADVVLVITRFQMTQREQVREIEEWNYSGLFKPLAVVFNGVRVKGYYGYKYGYYYTKRRYGTGYYTIPEQEGGKGERSEE
jgi:capsular exopolysaccharide synthesis family protein